MAFPLNQQQLIHHLRTSYLVLDEESDYTRKLLKPIPLSSDQPQTVPIIPDSPLLLLKLQDI